MISKKDIYKLNGLLYLHALSKAGSKREVSETLGVSVDTVNKYLRDLESEMKTCFFMSSGRGTILTPEGQRVMKIADEVCEAIRKLDNYEEMASTYAGIVRLWMPDAISQFLGTEALAAFLEKYPSIRMHSVISNELPDINSLEADICISYGFPASQDMVVMHEQKIRGGLFASEKYLEMYGYPKNLDDLAENHRICYKESNMYLSKECADLFARAKNVVYKTTSISSLRTALKAGVGIGACPLYWGRENLVSLNRLNFNFDVRLYLMVHKDIKDMPRIRVTLDFLKQLIQNVVKKKIG